MGPLDTRGLGSRGSEVTFYVGEDSPRKVATFSFPDRRSSRFTKSRLAGDRPSSDPRGRQFRPRGDARNHAALIMSVSVE